MGKYLPKKGKVHKNNESGKAQVIVLDLSLLKQIFPHINHKLIEYIYMYHISSGYFVNKCPLKLVISKQIFSNEEIFTVIGKFSSFKITTFLYQ